jgi:hypothetical protein
MAVLPHSALARAAFEGSFNPKPGTGSAVPTPLTDVLSLGSVCGLAGDEEL